MSRVAAVLLILLAFPPAAAAGGSPLELLRPSPDLFARPNLALDRRGLGAIAGLTLAAWGFSAAARARLDLAACRWCEPGRLDLRVRDALRWHDTDAAAKASDVLLLAVPLGSAAAVGLLAAGTGERHEIAGDLLVIASAVALTEPLTATVKHGAGRVRPNAWAAGSPGGMGDLHSFFSGHTSRVFAAAAAAAQVGRLRGRPGWKWVAAAAFVASAGTAWLRVAADQHWATDVLAGAAAGTAVGLTVPALMLRRSGVSPILAIAPAPGGIAIAF